MVVSASTDQAIPQHVFQCLPVLTVSGDLAELRHKGTDRLPWLVHSGVEGVALHDEGWGWLLMLFHEGDECCEGLVLRFRQ